jgi:hypothetical protein
MVRSLCAHDACGDADEGVPAVVLCAAYKSEAYPGGFNDVVSAGFLSNFPPLNTATMRALDEHHGGLPVCLAIQPDSRGALDLFYRDLSGAGGTQRIGVPPRFLLEDDLPDLIRWAKTETFEACHLPKDSLSPYAPVELIIRLPRDWYAAKKDQLNCVLFMPHFTAVTERSEEQGVVTLITECLAGYLQDARTVRAEFVICYPQQQNPLLSVVAFALMTAAGNSGKSPMRLDGRVLGTWPLPCISHSKAVADTF